MHISQLKESKFLKKEDCGRGILCTIKGVRQENVAKEGAPEELKWCLYLDEQEKPMVLNSTNGQLIAQITKQEDTDHWVGAKIVLYEDPSITFGGKLVGGIRVRAPRNLPPPMPAPKPAPAPVPRQEQPRAAEELRPQDDDVPF